MFIRTWTCVRTQLVGVLFGAFLSTDGQEGARRTTRRQSFSCTARVLLALSSLTIIAASLVVTSNFSSLVLGCALISGRISAANALKRLSCTVVLSSQRKQWLRKWIPCFSVINSKGLDFNRELSNLADC